eukprot:TRINITY_DN16508_c1_g1_i1.p1 TRINITY_DN16508_c1_g1~~TRINITY_DN16508_c1_g1_i1.p1  ORF type:complete len:1279 (+),score=383.52 TRINITY_DN16508_c1_g1_i1:121-3957(+)
MPVSVFTVGVVPVVVMVVLNAVLIGTSWGAVDSVTAGQEEVCLGAGEAVRAAMVGGFSAMEEVLGHVHGMPGPIDPVAVMRRTRGLLRAVHVYNGNAYMSGCIDAAAPSAPTQTLYYRKNDTALTPSPSLNQCLLRAEGSCQVRSVTPPPTRLFGMGYTPAGIPGGHWFDTSVPLDLSFESTISGIFPARLFAYHRRRADGVRLVAIADDLALGRAVSGLAASVVKTSNTVAGLELPTAEAASYDAIPGDSTAPVALVSSGSLTRCGGLGLSWHPLTAYYVQFQEQPHYDSAVSRASLATVVGLVVSAFLCMLLVLFAHVFRVALRGVTVSCEESVSTKAVQDVTLYLEYPRSCLIEFSEPTNVWEALEELAYRLNQYKSFIPQMLLDNLKRDQAGDAASPRSSEMDPHLKIHAQGAMGGRLSNPRMGASPRSPRSPSGRPRGRLPSNFHVEVMANQRKSNACDGVPSPRTGSRMSVGKANKEPCVENEEPTNESFCDTEGSPGGASSPRGTDDSDDRKSVKSSSVRSAAGGRRMRPRGLRTDVQNDSMAASLRIRKATVLYIGVDILNAHTVFVEQHTTLSNHFVRTAFDVAKHYEGVVVNLGPNSASITWNCHKALPQHCLQGCQAALDLSAQLDSLFGTAFDWSFGLASGNAFVGQTGGAEQKTVMVAGEPMYLSKKLSTLSMRLSCKILVNEVIFDQVQTQMYLRLVDSVPLPVETVRKRLREPDWDVESYDTHSSDDENTTSFHGTAPQTALVYQLISVRGGEEEREEVHPELYIEAFSFLRRNKFKQSCERFSEYLVFNPNCYQAFRLNRLAQSLQLKAATQRVPNPYYRRDLGYDSTEQRAVEASVVPPEVQAVPPPFVALTQLDEWVALLCTDPPPTVSPASKSMRRGQLAALAVSGRSPFTMTMSQSPASLALAPGNLIGDRPASPASKSLLAGGVENSSRISRTSSTGIGEMAHPPEMRKWFAAGIALQPLDENEPPIDVRNARGDRWWRSRKRVGTGDFGAVWKAMSDDGGMVVLKTMRIPEDAPRAVVEEVVAEISMLSRLRHDNLTAYHSSFTHGGYFFIVLEYMSGGSLGGLLDQFSIVPLSSTVRYLKDILRGLQFLHSQDIVHGDIKPHNVLLLIDGQCKLSDYGSAHCLSKLVAAKDKKAAGTPLYMAPEACRDEYVLASDIWSVGILTVRMTTGALPYTFTEEEPLEEEAFIKRLGSDESYRPVVRTEGLSRYTVSFIDAALSDNPEERLTCEDLLLTPMLNVTHDTSVSTLPTGPSRVE